MRNALAILLSLAAAQAVAEESSTAARIARLVGQPDIAAISAPLIAALSASSPRVRATAARVVAVRDVKSAAAAVVEQLGHERDIAAAREEIRTLALLYGKDQVATMLAAAARFQGRLDADLALALGRGAGPAAVELYTPKLAHLALSPDDRVAFFRYALWGFPRVMAPVATRIMADDDAAAWEALLQVASESGQEISGGVLLAALQHVEPAIRTAAALYLAARPAGSVRSYGSELQTILAQPPSAERAAPGADETIAMDLLGRSLGQQPATDLPWPAMTARLAAHLPEVERLLSKKELELLKKEKASRRALPPPGEDLNAMPPAVLTNLPAGLTGELLLADRCDGTWLGNARFAIDRGGRLSKVSVADVRTSKPCEASLVTLLELSLAEPRTTRTPIGEGSAIVAHGEKGKACFDEAPVRAEIGEPLGPVQPGGVVKPPRVVRRVEPHVPLGGQSSDRNGLVIVRTVITVDGCLRDFQIIHAGSPLLTTSTIVAASQWQFEPATWNGKPVETIFYLTTNFHAP